MTLNKLIIIKALGNLLQYYHSDLRYILNFQRYKQNEFSSSEYLQISPGSFQSFLNEFGIARNVPKKNVGKLLARTEEWIKCSDVDNVDKFAKELRSNKLTHEGKTMTSLASKILFLNNPWDIIPLDTLNKKAVNVRTNRYHDFYDAILEIKKNKTLPFDGPFGPIQEYLDTIESEFKDNLKDIHLIRRNRYLDKILWMLGQT